MIAYNITDKLYYINQYNDPHKKPNKRESHTYGDSSMLHYFTKHLKKSEIREKQARHDIARQIRQWVDKHNHGGKQQQ
jgi:hypothetical protein